VEVETGTVVFPCVAQAMSAVGQTEKHPVRANVFRLTPESGHRSIQPACLKGARSGSVATGQALPHKWTKCKLRCRAAMQRNALKSDDQYFPRQPLKSLLSGLSGAYDLSLYRRGARAPVAKCTTLMLLTTALSEGGARGLLWHRLDRMFHSRHHPDLRVAWRFRSFRHCGVIYWRICLA